LFLSFTLFILSFKSTTIFWNKQEISSKVSEKVFQQHVDKQMKSPQNPQLSPFSLFNRTVRKGAALLQLPADTA
jgi:hypothetical protein